MDFQNKNEFYMKSALEQAQLGFDRKEVPIGAIIVQDDEVLGKSFNLREQLNDYKAHAEILCLDQACAQLNNWRLSNCTIYVTLEPCLMCLGAMLNARIDHLVFGCFDSKRSSSHFPSLKNLEFIEGNNHQMKITSGVLEKDCREVLKKFFKEKRLRG